MKYFNIVSRSTAFLILIMLFSFVDINAQSVDGDDSMDEGQTKTYSLVGGSYTNINWGVTGGSLESSNGGYQMDIKSTTGANLTISVTFQSNGNPDGTGKTVQVRPNVPVPNFEVIYTDCEPTSLKRNNSPTSPVKWYWQGKNNTNGERTDLGFGDTYSLNGIGNYYLRAYNGHNWSQSSAAKNITQPTAPATPTVNSPTTRTICSGDETTFTISGPTTGWTYQWYEGSTQVHSGTSFPTSPTTSKTYTVKATDDKGCTSPARTMQVTVNNVTLPAAGNNSNSCNSQSSTQISAISASGFSGEHVWYTHPTNTAPTSKTVTVTSQNGQYVSEITVNSGDQNEYWVAEKIGLCISNRRKVTATFNNYSVNAGSINGNQTICYDGDPTTLGNQSSPSGGNGTFTYQWEISSTGTSGWNPISGATNSTYNPPSLQKNTRWYRRVATSCGQSDETNTIQVTVRAELTAGSINGGSQSVCQGIPLDPLGNASNPTGGDTSNYSYTWYVSNNQNGPWSSAISGATSSSYTPAATIGTRWYRRGVTSCNDIKYTTAKSVTVKSVPDAPSVSDNNVNTCDSNVVTLTATSTSTSVNHIWYTSQFELNTVTPTQTNNGATVSSYNVTLSGSDISYWVAAEQNGCISDRTEVKATYVSTGSTPTITLVDSSTDTNRCGSGDFILTANITNGSSNNLTWYDGSGSSANQVGTGPSLQITLDYTDMDNAGKKKFWVEGTLVNSSNCSFPMAQRMDIEVSLDPLPNAPTTTNATVMRCGSGSVTLAATPSGGSTIEWFDSPTGGNSQGIGNSLTTNITQNSTLYAENVNSITGCRSADRLAVEAKITTGIYWYPDEDQDGFADTLDSASIQESCDEPAGNWTSVNTLDNCPGEYSLENVLKPWYGDNDNDTLGDPSEITYACNKPDGYVGNSDDLCPGITSSTNDCEITPSPNCTNDPPVTYTGDNYVYNRTYQKSAFEMQNEEGIDQNNFDFFTASSGVIQEITFFDGLGRPMQQIGIDQSPNKNDIQNFGDIITYMEYDDFGRMEKEFLPYATTEGNLGSFRSDALSKTILFYSDTDDRHENTNNPFSQKDFEPSPLNRILKQASPGDDWAMNGGHEIEFVYQTNTSADGVKRFDVNLAFANNTYTPTIEIKLNYLEGELTKNTIKDENHTSGKNHTIEEFTDKFGRVVLKRTYADIDANNDGDLDDAGDISQAPHDTYYVYDDFGNLTFVLPPKMNGNPANMNELGYQYVYDYRNRLVEKRIPGKGKEYIVYNKLDQPILTQDANQREKSTTSDEWLFTKYDAFGRVAYTGKATTANGVSRTEIQQEVDGLTDLLWVVQQTTDRDIEYAEEVTIYYNNGAYPHEGNDTLPAPKVTLGEVLTVNYYDDYVDRPAGAELSITILDDPNNTISATNVKGLPTVSKVKVLDQTPAKWISTLTYYDTKGRPVYTYSVNEYLGTIDIMETSLDFIGKPLKTRTTHTRNGDTIITIDNFTYDHVGRLLTQTQCIGDATMGNSCPEGEITDISTELVLSGPINDTRVHHQGIVVTDATLSPDAHLYINPTSNRNASQELIVLNTYDNLGLLESKKVGGSATVANQTVSANGLQEVAYKYNVRGWLTDINNINSTDKLFSFNIGYNQGTNPLYNGNISQTQWRTDNVEDKSLKSYNYGYDALNRITMATDNTGYYSVGSPTSPITYDKNGNIQKLLRLGHINDTAILSDNDQNDDDFEVMDELTYVYSGNQLQTVTDFGAATGFKDGGSTGGVDYAYDANGNMIEDLNKGIKGTTANEDGIDYNHLNLPTTVRIDNGSETGTISYIYDATGVKLQKNVLTNGNTKVTDYAGNYIYEKPSGGSSALQFFSTPEGYVEPKSADNLASGYNYIYQYKDHLGNVRLSYTDNNGTTEIVEENNYYPFGLKHKGYNNVVNSTNPALKYKFGGKEYQDELGLGWYDVTARNYDPALGRWMNVDPLADKYSEFSPYIYTVNNPIRYIDADGEDPIDPRTGKPYKINLFTNSVISHSVDYSKSNRDEDLHERVNSRFFKLFPRGQRGGDTGVFEGHSQVTHDLTTNLISEDANELITGFLDLPSSVPFVSASQTSDVFWSKASDSGTYSFINPTYAEDNLQVDGSFAEIISVKDNVVSQVTRMFRNKEGEFDVSSTLNFEVEKGEIQTREKSIIFGLFKTTEKFRVLNVTQTSRVYSNNKLVAQRTNTYTTEEIIE